MIYVPILLRVGANPSHHWIIMLRTPLDSHHFRIFLDAPVECGNFTPHLRDADECRSLNFSSILVATALPKRRSFNAAKKTARWSAFLHGLRQE